MLFYAMIPCILQTEYMNMQFSEHSLPGHWADAYDVMVGIHRFSVSVLRSSCNCNRNVLVGVLLVYVHTSHSG